VIRQYLGAGPEAHSAAALDARRRQEREAGRLARRAEGQRQTAADAPPRAFGGIADLLAGAALVLAGYRRHGRGEWRKALHMELRGDDARR
jgi:hypothetical protein